MDLPESIKVGPFNYTVEQYDGYDSLSNGQFGFTDNRKCRIVVDIDHSTLEQAQNTLLHEVLHACWHVAGLNDGDNEERIVNSLANVLQQVISDNAELIEYLNLIEVEVELED